MFDRAVHPHPTLPLEGEGIESSSLMSLSPLEQTVLAYYAATQASTLAPAPRWYPYGELILIVEDKVAVAVRKFGFKAKACAKASGTAFLDAMIAKGAWTTTQNDFGGAMHQFQPDVYKAALEEFNAADPIVQKAADGGDTFWAETFAELTK